MITDKRLSSGLSHREERADGTTVLHLAGDVDATSVDVVALLVQLADRPPLRLHLAAGDVTFIDSTGLKAILRLAHAVHQHRGTVSMEASEPVRRLAWLCGVGHILGMATQTSSEASASR
jgi:anti-anti-sigma factor